MSTLSKPQRVKVYDVEDRSKKRPTPNPHIVKWRVDGRDKTRAFPSKDAAEDFRARLIVARNSAEKFDTTTGEPIAWRSTPTLLSYATSWFAGEWREWSPAQRKSAAETLPVVVYTFSHYRLYLQPLRLRKVALRERVRDNDGPVSSTGQALRWVARGELATLGLPAPIRKLLGN